MRAGLVTVTVTPGRTPPLESVTVPAMTPVWPICAIAIPGIASKAAASRVSTFVRMGRSPVDTAFTPNIVRSGTKVSRENGCC